MTLAHECGTSSGNKNEKLGEIENYRKAENSAEAV